MKLRENSYTFQTVNQNNAAIVLYRLDYLFIDIIHLFTKNKVPSKRQGVWSKVNNQNTELFECCSNESVATNCGITQL